MEYRKNIWINYGICNVREGSFILTILTNGKILFFKNKFNQSFNLYALIVVNKNVII
jgi:hypothetical protein